MGTFNLLLENLDPLAELLLQALFRSFWQGLLIAALVWLLLRVFKQASATTRHAVWLASLLIIAALPLVAIATRRDAQSQSSPVQPYRAPVGTQAAPVAVPQTTTFLPPVTLPINDLMEQRAAQRPASSAPPRLFEEYDRAAQVEQTSRVVTLAESARVARPVTLQAPPPVIKKSFGERASEWVSTGRWPLALVAAWLLASAMMMARIFHSYYSLCGLRRSLGPASGEQQDRARYLADLIGVRRRVGLFTTTRVAMPMTIGALEPIIVLPTDLARTLSPSESTRRSRLRSRATRATTARA